ncbi:hypothetical protein MTR_0030s0380 [Medicago truncatula]|uniref:Uncharacterized protein n=1 Tax=Medicago truncatula TaxID=3880 RepID=A0A072TJ48_MEDTR|nr:hypothetical protein MTR_0030s0380 [Medicago truncatula]
MEQRPSTDRRAWNGLSYLFVEGNGKSSRRIGKVYDDGVHDGPSRGLWEPWANNEVKPN